MLLSMAEPKIDDAIDTLCQCVLKGHLKAYKEGLEADV